MNASLPSRSCGITVTSSRLLTVKKQLVLVRGKKSRWIMGSHGTQTPVSWVEVLDCSHHPSCHHCVDPALSYTTLLLFNSSALLFV